MLSQGLVLSLSLSSTLLASVAFFHVICVFCALRELRCCWCAVAAAHLVTYCIIINICYSSLKKHMLYALHSGLFNLIIFRLLNQLQFVRA